MRKLMMTAAVLTLFSATAPALALECNGNQGKAVELDFKVGVKGQPLPTLEFRTVGERCIDSPSVYTLKGMVGKFSSDVAVRAAFNTIRSLRTLNLSAEDLPAMMKFVGEVEAKAAK
ncbi:MAG: hypothetical protein Q8R25_01430 [bacterium]|nr:hypothetical protein [bacterium]